MIEELFHLHRLLDEINQELNILSDFQRSSACSALLIMVRRVSCGLQLATVPELQVDYNEDGNLDDGGLDVGSCARLKVLFFPASSTVLIFLTGSSYFLESDQEHSRVWL